MDALINPLIYVVSTQAPCETHIVNRAFRSYERALACKEEYDAKWADKGFKHFITVTSLDD